MNDVTPELFEEIVSDAIDAIPKRYLERLENVAFIVEDEPSDEQRQRLHLHPNMTLLGLYEGAPLPTRFGQTKLLPDKITLFKIPLLAASRDMEDLKKKIHNTIWHEVAHYFGLDHGRINELEHK
jgi:predicted Zn-dependent protease with MMP-like domain